MRLIGSNMRTNNRDTKSAGSSLDPKSISNSSKSLFLHAIAICNIIVVVYQLKTLLSENLLPASSQEEEMRAPRKKLAPIGERNEIITSPIFLDSSSPQAQAGKCVYETIAKANSMSSLNNSVLETQKTVDKYYIFIPAHPKLPPALSSSSLRTTKNN